MQQPVPSVITGMASASNLVPIDQENISCAICLDVFSIPVTTPCGHNFCKTCITKVWDRQIQCKCPFCNERFQRRPELKVNTFIAEMADQFRKIVQVKEKLCVKPGEVPCDVCTGPQFKAVKSCLVCLVSYCNTHLEPHQRVSGLKRHKLIDPVDRLEDRMCKKHDRLLELFCKGEQVYVCQCCKEKDHKCHQVVPLKEEYEVKKAQLGKMESEVQHMIQERQRKIQEIKHTVRLSIEDADREIARGLHAFTAWKLLIKKFQNDFNKTIQDKRKSTENQAARLITELEQEIHTLTKSRSGLELLSHTEDHFQFLQRFRSQEIPRHTRNWATVEVGHPSYVGTLRRSLVQLEGTLNVEMKKLNAKLPNAELNSVQRYIVDVTLDPDTANPRLFLSDDGKQVYTDDVMKDLPRSPGRFRYYLCVLAKQSFSSGRFYFEVRVKSKTSWGLGVVQKSIRKNEGNSLSTSNGYWTVWLDDDAYVAVVSPNVWHPLRAKPQTVGVFVDYDEGLVSFYDVEVGVCIYSFTGYTFSEPLYPFFNPRPSYGGENAAPLVLATVDQTVKACRIRPSLRLAKPIIVKK